MSEFNIALLGLLGAVVGAVPVLVGVVGAWFKDRDRIATEKRTLELAKLEVEFVSAWIDTAAKFSGDEVETQKAMARARLCRLLADEAPTEMRSSGGPIRSAKGTGRTAFLIYLGFYCFMIFGASIDDDNNVSLSHLMNELQGEGAGAMTVLAVPLVVLLVRWRRLVKRASHGAA